MLESYLEGTKVLLAEALLSKPKNNLPPTEQKELEKLRKNTNINLKKADKGTRTVILNTENKILEGQVQLDNNEHYRLLESPMVKETSLTLVKIFKGSLRILKDLHEDLNKDFQGS